MPDSMPRRMPLANVACGSGSKRLMTSDRRRLQPAAHAQFVTIVKLGVAWRLQERCAPHIALLTISFQRVHPQSAAGVSVAHVGAASDDPLNSDPGGLTFTAVVESKMIGGEAGIGRVGLVAPGAQQSKEG